MARPNKGLSTNKTRYRYERVLTVDGVPVPHLLKRLGKYYAQLSAPKDGKIKLVYFQLKTDKLNEAIAQTVQLTGRCAIARARFKMRPPQTDHSTGSKEKS